MKFLVFNEISLCLSFSEERINKRIRIIKFKEFNEVVKKNCTVKYYISFLFEKNYENERV